MAFSPAGLGLAASGVLAGLSLFGEPRPPVRPPPLRVKVYILPAPGYYGGGAPGYYGGGAPGYYGGGRGTKKEKKKKKKPHGKGNAGSQGVFRIPEVLAARGEQRLCSQKLNLQSEEESESDESEEESESESDSEEEEDESDDEETVHQPAGRAYY